MLKNVFILCLIIFYASCTYHSEENLYPTTICDTTSMSLSNDITQLLENYNCNGCHDATNNSGNVNIEGYDNLKKWVDNSKLLKSIKHNGASPMPKGAGKMAQCDIDKIEAWINQGAQNN